jgi:hypothetical protein
MELTVGALKKILESVDDDVILADLEYGNTTFRPFNNVKRLLLLKANGDWDNKTYLVINGQGSHFTREGEQKSLTYLKKYWDETTIKK